MMFATKANMRAKPPPEAPTKYVPTSNTDEPREPAMTPIKYINPTRRDPCTSSSGIPIMS